MHVPPANQTVPVRRAWLALTLTLLMLGLLYWRQLGHDEPTTAQKSEFGRVADFRPPTNTGGILPSRTRAPVLSPAGPERSAAEEVAERLRRFARLRWRTTEEMAEHLGIEIPPEIAAFFRAVEEDRWDDVVKLWERIHELTHAAGPSPANDVFRALSPVVLETFGVAEAAHEWPPAALLAYGNFVLGAVEPGQVYVGGTDAGRFIPTLLNETSGDPHLVLTQNALADKHYLEYVRFLYGDRLPLPPQAEIDRIHAAVAQELGLPKLERHFGQDVVMDVNGRLLAAIAEQNPELRFAVEESRPLPNTYAGATAAGPLYEFGATENPQPMNAESAGQTVTYWEDSLQTLRSDPATLETDHARRSFAKLADGQANVLLNHGHAAEAEQVYRLALQLSPELPDPMYHLVTLLSGQGRPTEALAVLDQHAGSMPDNQREQIRQMRELLAGRQP